MTSTIMSSNTLEANFTPERITLLPTTCLKSLWHDSKWNTYACSSKVVKTRMGVYYPYLLVQLGDSMLSGFLQLQKFGLFMQLLFQISYLPLQLLKRFTTALTQPKHKCDRNEMAYSKICIRGLPAFQPYYTATFKIMIIAHPIKTISLMRASYQTKATYFEYIQQWAASNILFPTSAKKKSFCISCKMKTESQHLTSLWRTQV